MILQNVGPLVSIIMPLYNAEKYISSAIESILHQTYFNFELIIIDDGSSDGSADICKSYALKDHRIRYYFEENSGICAARNLGLLYAKGEYIAFCDDDDEYDKDLLKDNLEILIQSDADLVKFGREIKHLGGTDDGWTETFDIPEGEYANNQIRKNFAELEFKGAFMFVWDSIFMKSLLTVNDGIISFDTSFTSGYEDVDFNLRLVPKIHKLIVRSKIYYTHFMRTENSTSLKYSKAKLDGLMKTVRMSDNISLLFALDHADVENIDAAEKMLTDNNMAISKLLDNAFILDGLGEKIYQCLMLLLSEACDLSKQEKLLYLKMFMELKSINIAFSKAAKKSAKQQNRYRYLLYSLLKHKHFRLLFAAGKLKSGKFS